MFLVHYMADYFSLQTLKDETCPQHLSRPPWGGGDQQPCHPRGSAGIYLNLIRVVLVLHTDDTQTYGNEHSDVPHFNICSAHEHTVTRFT